ncbi:hypothetical protein [Vibrio phage RYC]|nr:hypothetical protein [Vibrio phage RYC]
MKSNYPSIKYIASVLSKSRYSRSQYLQLSDSNNSDPVAPSLDYDTIVAVGSSGTAGIIDLTEQFETPFRGMNFKTGAIAGTTLQNMIDNVTNFTSQAQGRTLFLMTAGVNDANTYLSPDGVFDTSPIGPIHSWNTISQLYRDTAMARYHELCQLLQPHGDIAFTTFYYVDVRSELSTRPNKGRDVHFGSWNDEVIIPLCQQYGPQFMNPNTGRPWFDFYEATIEDSDTILDDDNLHYYNDVTYSVNGQAGYNDGAGYHTLREYMIDIMGQITNMPSAPYNEALYKDRILVNVGRTATDTFTYRPSHQRWANNLGFSSANERHTGLRSYNGTVTGVNIEANFSHNPSARGNLDTTSTTNQPWDEGCGDTNIASSAIATQSGRTHILTFDNLNEAGEICLLGLYSAGATYDATHSTIFRITDDNGQRELEVPSSINGTTVNLTDCMARFAFDSTASGTLTVQFLNGSQHNYGSLSAISLDIAK